MRNLVVIFSCVIIRLSGQTIDNSVINSAGQTHTINSNFIYTDNIGEPFVSTEFVGTYTFTQGFLQIFDGPKVFVTYNPVSCTDRKDGNISVSVSNVSPTQTVSYLWSPSSICPNATCNNVDSLNAGTYSLIISIKTPSGTGFLEKFYPQNAITIEDKNGPCRVKIYNTITANGDGINDFLTIDNLEEFPDHELLIYNRWGKLLKSIKNYKNDNGWPAKGETIISGTYFYVLDLGKGIKPIKGWVELLNN
jgi:gliding motility-associated-like protein